MIVGAAIDKVIGAVEVIVVEEWSSPLKNLLWPLAVEVVAALVVFVVGVVECSAKREPTWSVGISIGLCLFPYKSLIIFPMNT